MGTATTGGVGGALGALGTGAVLPPDAELLDVWVLAAAAEATGA
ncbi:MAG TPA: hypothetical protein VNY27_10155 [Solirubrobacteraceae bacterium]|nr:hypothetical protein [Solirubrobacteraceae bacterium]